MAKVDVEELKAGLRSEIEQHDKQLQVMVNSLVMENMDLKTRIRNTGLKLADIEMLVKEALAW